MVDNPRFPHKVIIKRFKQGDPFDGTGADNDVVYSGICRSYTTRRAFNVAIGNVLSGQRILSIPLKRDEWVNMPEEGDEVEVTIGVVTEYGIVVDKLPNNFGTNVVWRYGRN